MNSQSIISMLIGVCHGLWASPNDYCTHQCNHTLLPHVRCINSECTLQQPCTGLPLFSQQEITDIVNFQNLLRSRVATGNVPGQPPAKNMRSLSWDKELESLAKCWVDYCPNTMSACTDLPPRLVVRQNIIFKRLSNASALYTIKTFKALLIEWFAQYEVFAISRKEYEDREYAQYTQLIWADTYLVGCARNTFVTQWKESVLIFVCNYAPAGNIPRVLVYLPGDTCSACPEQTRCSTVPIFKGLCVFHRSMPNFKSIVKKRLSALNSSCIKIPRFILFIILKIIFYSFFEIS